MGDSVLGPAERQRPVRLCARISGSRRGGDLAQETLLEAWRNLAKLHDRTGIDSWLAAIARHVCRRRATQSELTPT